MNIRIESVSASTPISEWNDFVRNHPEGNFFQYSKVFHFFSSIEGHEPFAFIASREKEIVGLLAGIIIGQRSGIMAQLSQRCIIWGGPLIKNNNPDVAESLFESLNENVGKKVIYTEFRNLNSTEKLYEVFAKYGFNYTPHLNFKVDIEGLKHNQVKISSSRKRQIKKAFKAGTIIREVSTDNELKQFYTILKKLYKEKVKKPLADYDFFLRFFERPELGKIFIILYEEKVIGGIMCPISDSIIYEWYVCGLDYDYKEMYPSVLATWAPIEYAMNNNLKIFDFMGAGKPDEDYGVREFKSKFGGELVEHGRYIRINKPMLYKLGKTGIKLLGKL